MGAKINEFVDDSAVRVMYLSLSVPAAVSGPISAT